MSGDKPDLETSRALREGQEFEDLVNSSGWKRARRMLMEKIILLDSISAIPKEGKNAEQILNEALAREGAATVVMEWLAEVEGKANHSKSTKELLQDAKRDSLVERLD